jgi:serine/threonine protein kinase
MRRSPVARAGTYNGVPVAVKFPNAALAAHARGRAMFHRETMLTSTLRHPFLVSGYGVVDGAQCGQPNSGLVMELVPVDMIACTAYNVPVMAPPIARLLWMWQATTALAYVHSRGVLHCDIKPLNMMVAGDGTARLMDLGTAKLLPGAGGPDDRVPARDGAGGSVVRTAAFVGTSLYADTALLQGTLDADAADPAPLADMLAVSRMAMAEPAVRGGGSADAPSLCFSAATDVYAMACSIVEVLTGCPPWRALDPSRALRDVADLAALHDRTPGGCPFPDAIMAQLYSGVRTACGSDDVTDRICSALSAGWSRTAAERPTAASLAAAMSPSRWAAGSSAAAAKEVAAGFIASFIGLRRSGIGGGGGGAPAAAGAPSALAGGGDGHGSAQLSGPLPLAPTTAALTSSIGLPTRAGPLRVSGAAPSPSPAPVARDGGVQALPLAPASSGLTWSTLGWSDAKSSREPLPAPSTPPAPAPAPSPVTPVSAAGGGPLRLAATGMDLLRSSGGHSGAPSGRDVTPARPTPAPAPDPARVATPSDSGVTRTLAASGWLTAPGVPSGSPLPATAGGSLPTPAPAVPSAVTAAPAVPSAEPAVVKSGYVGAGGASSGAPGGGWVTRHVGWSAGSGAAATPMTIHSHTVPPTPATASPWHTAGGAGVPAMSGAVGGGSASWIAATVAPTPSAVASPAHSGSDAIWLAGAAGRSPAASQPAHHGTGSAAAIWGHAPAGGGVVGAAGGGVSHKAGVPHAPGPSGAPEPTGSSRRTW